MKRTTPVLSKMAFAAAVFAAVFSAACKNALLPEPEMEKIQGAASNRVSEIEAPTGLKVSQGKCQEVSLSWTGSSAATQYLIYSAGSLFDTFKQVGETANSATTFTLKEEAGTTAYYKICAKDYEGNLSLFSETVQGSTMATPVITAITSSTDGTSVTIDWYMENCNDDTYQKYTIYEILCTTESKDIVAQKAFSAAESETTQITIDGLQPKTTYYYEVSAYSSQYADDTKETSSRVSQETLRLSIPGAPIDLAASKGTSADTITLEWTLPSFCEISASGGTYTKNPLYFTIERKPESADDSAYKKIVSYLGTITETTDDKAKIRFTCLGDEGADSGIIAQEETSQGLVQVRAAKLDAIEESGIEAYKKYIPSYTISYFDKNVERGQKYAYRVQSYVDGTAKKITADTSVAATTGNLISRLAFNPNPGYKQDGTKILSIDVAFKTDFDALGQNYDYALVRTFSPATINGAETGPAPSTVREFSALSALAAYHDLFDFEQNLDTVQGYYQYTLYVCNDGTADSLAGKGDDEKIAEYARLAITSVRQEGKTTVLNDSSLMPKIERFDIKDGYKDKFILSWNYEDACEYTVFWKSDGSGEEQSLLVPAGNITVDKDTKTATFEHEAVSGETRTYRLRAYAGMETEKTCNDEEGNLRIVQTLGTARPVMGDVSYDSISVTWPAVQMAQGEEYTVEAAYEDGESILDGATVGRKMADDGSITYTITQPKGYDNATLSGKPVTLKVTAKSGVDESVGECTVRTLGPALVNATAKADDKAITLTWNKVAGAKGYLIYRTMHDAQGAYIAAADTYYYDIDTKKVRANGQELSDTKRVTVNNPAGTTISLTDSYCDAEDTSAYQQRQESIFWGDPFGYTVLPVLTEDDFTFDYVDASVTLDSGCAVDYTGGRQRTLAKVLGATTGYARNVRADKSQSATEQKITWAMKQYKPGTPRVFRRRYSSTDPFVRVPIEETLGTASSALTYTVPDSDIYTPFEYIVKYGNDTSILDKDVPKALIKTFRATLDERYTYRSAEETEPCYKGYLFTMMDIGECGITADWAVDEGHPNADPYAERITWNKDIPWDYNNRAVGPSGVVISIRNNNLSDKWDEAVRFTSPVPAADNMTVSGTDITVTPLEDGNGILVSPESIVSGGGTTSGMLKVLRDYKHYYALSFTRDGLETKKYTPGFGDFVEKDKNGNVDEAANEKLKVSASAYRQITDEELVKATMLILAAIEHDSDSQSHTTGGSFSLKGASGSFSGKGSISSAMSWHLAQYKHKWKKLPSGDTNIPAFLTLNDQEGTKGRKYSKYFVHLSTDGGASFKIDKPISIDVSSEVYGTKTITVASSADKFRATVNSNIYSTEGNENCRYWMPMEWYKSGASGTQTSYGYFGESSQYGWWPSSN